MDRRSGASELLSSSSKQDIHMRAILSSSSTNSLCQSDNGQSQGILTEIFKKSDVLATDHAFQEYGQSEAKSRKRNSGPTATVDDQRVFADGYLCHPAVSDNSMHIGILAGTQDHLSRVPVAFDSYRIGSQANKPANYYASAQQPVVTPQSGKINTYKLSSGAANKSVELYGMHAKVVSAGTVKSEGLLAESPRPSSHGYTTEWRVAELASRLTTSSGTDLREHVKSRTMRRCNWQIHRGTKREHRYVCGDKADSAAVFHAMQSMVRVLQTRGKSSSCWAQHSAERMQDKVLELTTYSAESRPGRLTWIVLKTSCSYESVSWFT